MIRKQRKDVLNNDHKCFILNQTIAILQNSGSEIFQLDIKTNRISKFQGKDFIDINISTTAAEELIHSDDYKIYTDTFYSLKNKITDNASVKLRTFNARNNLYTYYEYQFSIIEEVEKKIERIICIRKDITSNIEQEIKIDKEINDAKEYGANLKMILDKLPVSLSIKDPISKIYSYFNNASYDWIECKCGCSSKDLFDKSTLDEIEKKEMSIIETGEVYTENEVLTLIDGTILDTFVKKIPIEFEGKKQILIASIDLTEAKRSENKIKELTQQSEIILNNTNSGVIFIDKNFNIQWSNISKVFGDINGNDYRIGIKCYEGYGRTSPCPDCNAMSSFSLNCNSQTRIKNTVGKILEIVTIPIGFDNRTNGVLLKIDDRTEHYKIMDEMKIAKEEAIQSDVLKSAFLANMSHEIRTPLNAIVGFSELLTTTDDLNLRYEYSKIINNNSDLLLRLIDDILDLSKIEAGIFTLKSDCVNLNNIITETYTIFNHKINNSNVTLSYTIDNDNPIVVIDKKRFIQILNNFISNAIKYTPKGEINFGYRITNNKIRMFVKDTGIGIDESNKHNVFKRFQKFDDFAQGTGLGLAICKALIDNCKGAEIGFDSKLGYGSEFWAIIPCKIFSNPIGSFTSEKMKTLN